MRMLYFYVEEESAETALVELVPKILHFVEDWDFEIYRSQGKLDLLRDLPNRLKRHQYETNVDWRVIILLDRDDDDCVELKKKLETFCTSALLRTRSQQYPDYQVINRIACEELEAWFFGDIGAIVQAYPGVDRYLAKQAPFRDPDAISGGTWEQLERILAPYHPGGLEKIRAATEISRHMNPDINRSKSFQVFRDALRDLFNDA
jgi:hypothetical protein